MESYGLENEGHKRDLFHKLITRLQRVKSVGLENNEGHKNKRDFFHIENVMAAQQATKEIIVFLRSTRLERASLVVWDA